jgi:hypothetical protein
MSRMFCSTTLAQPTSAAWRNVKSFSNEALMSRNRLLQGPHVPLLVVLPGQGHSIDMAKGEEFAAWHVPLVTSQLSLVASIWNEIKRGQPTHGARRKEPLATFSLVCHARWHDPHLVLLDG